MTNPFVRTVFGDLFCDPAVAQTLSAPAFTTQMLRVEVAWTHALRDLGLVEADDAQAALDAMAAFDGDNLRQNSQTDGVPVPGLVRALRKGLPDRAAMAIHTGATSQDIVDTAMALSLQEVGNILRARLEQVAVAIADLDQRFGGADMMARTRMQAALPAQAGLRLSAWKCAVAGQIARADAAFAEISRVQVGGAIGQRDAWHGQGAAIATHVADELGLTPAHVWHTDRSGPVSFGHWLTLVSGTLGKIGQDIALMAQQGIDEVALKGGGGSSAMPHKQNPVAAEALVTLARFVAAQQGALSQALIHEQERSGAAWALEWMSLPAMCEATGAALNNTLALLARIDRVGST